MGGVIAIVGIPELHIAYAGVEEAPPTPRGDINHNHLSRLEISLVVTRLVHPTGLGRGDGGRLGIVHEAVDEAYVGLFH